MKMRPHIIKHAVVVSTLPIANGVTARDTSSTYLELYFITSRYLFLMYVTLFTNKCYIALMKLIFIDNKKIMECISDNIVIKL